MTIPLATNLGKRAGGNAIFLLALFSLGFVLITLGSSRRDCRTLVKECMKYATELKTTGESQYRNVNKYHLDRFLLYPLSRRAIYRVINVLAT